MSTLQRRFTRLSISLAFATALTLGAALPAFADGSSTVTGTPVAIADKTNVTFSAVALDGTNQDPTGTATIDVNDDSGTGQGWNVSFSATAFTSAEGKTLAADALSITAVTPQNNGTGTYTAPVNGVSYSLIPSAGSVKLFNAAKDSGMGHFRLTPAFALHIPANTYAGTYESTFTITVVAGP